MEIKKLTVGDAESVLEIMEKSFSTPWSLSTIENLVSSDSAACFGAFENGVLTGYAFLEWVLDEGSLTDIAVLPEFRRRGISRALMDALLNEVLLRSLSFVTLEVRDSNLPAINLYSKYGFLQVGKRPSYYSSPTEDALLMTKTF